MQFLVNGPPFKADVEPAMPLRWVLRDALGLTGTKYGCAAAACGACQVWAEDALGTDITTIEGLGTSSALPAVQRARIETQVAHCGYCQSGQIMQAVKLLITSPDPTDTEIDDVWTATSATVAPTRETAPR